MKVLQLFLVICLLVCLNCKSGRLVLSCAISKISNQVCDTMYKAVLKGGLDAYIALLDNQATLESAMKQCLY